MAEVTIVYRWLPQYRVAFYEGLRERLAREGITLRLVHGQPIGDDSSKGDAVELVWPEVVKNRVWIVAGTQFVWQPILGLVRRSDLVIVEQASKLLVNNILVLLNMLGLARVAFWGHGRNFQTHLASPIGERIKRWQSRHVAWWFAYNETSACAVRETGFPADRTTLVENTIDTSGMLGLAASLTERDTRQTRAEIGLGADHQVCVFVGGMYPEKRLGFLVTACDLIRERVPDFEMVFVGAGPDAAYVADACTSRDWMHYLGPRFGPEKNRIVASCELMLMPGLVGLAVIDSFALQTPMVTTNVPFHSPEIEYLVDGVNGMIIDAATGAEGYADRVIGLLQGSGAIEVLRRGCRESAATYTMGAMVENFAAGVILALGRSYEHPKGPPSST